MLNLRIRLVIAGLLSALCLPVTAQEEQEEPPRDCCNKLSLDVYDLTGDRNFAEMFYNACDEAWCLELREKQEPS